ncbi:transcription factor RFX4-like isoform X2 [Tetranychus urticae]|uniref:DNA-binding protein RFX6 n=1 Tax=Tetranychus urticae TaxID=32264 RepID=T1L395_TETUR|nr:transcription factor RFX4-like isoform X2 [Tetranychus urticae]
MSKRTQFFRCKSTEKILKWLETNYELCDDVCLPRCLLYKHYLDYCGSIKSEPISAAAFGKIIRRKFNKIATRRLGTRGQSKYHYFGLAIKKSSPYYGDYLENSQRLRTKLRKVGCRKKMLTSNHLNTNLIDKVNQLMDNFPQANEFVNPSNPAYRNIETFLCMYKTHCDHLADIIINFKLDSIQLHLRHFWLQLPCHFDRLLQSDLLSKLIQCCDYTFFEGLLNALYPQNFKTVSSQTLNYLNILTNNFELWLREALIGLPDSLISVKVEALHHFVRSIKRYKYLFPLIKSTTDLDTFFSSLRRLFHISLKNCQSSCIVSRSTEFILIVNRLIVCLCRELTINYVPTLNHWITLFSTIREYSILVAEETIRHDNFQINKLSIICWDNFSFDNINFCDSLLAR